MLHFFFNFFFQNHTRNYNRDLQPILNIKWPSRLNFASRKLTRTRLTIFFNVLQSIFFAIHIYNLQYNALPKKNFMNIFFSEDLPRWLGSFSLPWSLWAGKRRTLNSTKNRGFWDLGFMIRFLSKTWILFGFGWVLQEEETAWRRENILGSAKIFQAKQSDRHTVCLQSARSQ